MTIAVVDGGLAGLTATLAAWAAWKGLCYASERAPEQVRFRVTRDCEIPLGLNHTCGNPILLRFQLA